MRLCHNHSGEEEDLDERPCSFKSKPVGLRPIQVGHILIASEGFANFGVPAASGTEHENIH